MVNKASTQPLHLSVQIEQLVKKWFKANARQLVRPWFLCSLVPTDLGQSFSFFREAVSMGMSVKFTECTQRHHDSRRKLLTMMLKLGASALRSATFSKIQQVTKDEQHNWTSEIEAEIVDGSQKSDRSLMETTQSSDKQLEVLLTLELWP